MPTTNIEIAQKAQKTTMKPIQEIASRLGIPDAHLEPFGRYKAKISLEYLNTLPSRPESKLILMTAISPTPAGEGKTTTTIGLADGLNRIGKNAVACLREPCMGPVFGMKGGATGGGRSQVIPMEDINLHFTGDFHAIQVANNLLAAMIDNHIHHGNELGIDVRKVTWRRVLDVSDRSLREITIALGGTGNGYPRQDGFDIVVASEVMAILCLATSAEDLKQRLGEIVVASTRDGRPVRARDLQAHGAMSVILKEAIQPNLVQTIEGTPVFIHGGPFANIAHGCNSVIATRSAMKLADYVVTEAGFGADLGAEKFVNIKCRKSGLKPDAAVVVATVRAIKHHGGGQDLAALEKGISNLERHVSNLRKNFGLPCVVAINHFTTDQEEEIEFLRKRLATQETPVILSRHWAEGARGAEDLARAVVRLTELPPAELRYLYEDSAPLWKKMEAIAFRQYGASELTASPKVKNQIQKLQESGYGHLPICVAKTQYSFSTDPTLRGAPTGHAIDVREVRLAAGAGFIVMICGDIMTMPGLPKTPAAHEIDIDSKGRITGMF